MARAVLREARAGIPRTGRIVNGRAEWVPRFTQQRLDEWLPTVVHYIGILLMVALVVASIRNGLDYPSAFVAVGGMILYKYVAPKHPKEVDDHAERWSGLE